jgi:hypothetical protein
MNDDYTNQVDLESQNRDMTRDATHEREAEEWIEGLIADASTEG